MTSPADNIISLYERHARQWDADRARTSFPERAWLDRFAALLPAGAPVLDIGCGSGAPIARYLIERGLDVTGIDASPSLISLCRQRLPNHRWLVADMRTLDLGEKFQGLIAWDSLFHLAHDDQRDMFRVFAQHADESASLLFTSGTDHGVAMGSYADEPLYHASLATQDIDRCWLRTASMSSRMSRRIRAAASTRSGSRNAADAENFRGLFSVSDALTCKPFACAIADSLRKVPCALNFPRGQQAKTTSPRRPRNSFAKCSRDLTGLRQRPVTS